MESSTSTAAPSSSAEYEPRNTSRKARFPFATAVPAFHGRRVGLPVLRETLHHPEYSRDAGTVEATAGVSDYRFKRVPMPRTQRRNRRGFAFEAHAGDGSGHSADKRHQYRTLFNRLPGRGSGSQRGISLLRTKPVRTYRLLGLPRESQMVKRTRFRWDFRVSLWAIIAGCFLLIWLFYPVTCTTEPNNAKPDINTHFREKWRTIAVSDTITMIDTVYTGITAAGRWIPDTVYTPADTLPVEIITISTTDTVFIAATIDDVPVIFDTLVTVPLELPERRWLIFAEYNELGPAGGIGWRAFEWRSVQFSPAIGAGDGYAFAELRIHRRLWSGVSAGVGIGYRFVQDEGLHLGVGISIEL